MAGEPHGNNLPTYELNATEVAVRVAEDWPLEDAVDFTGGMNLSGSCAPGIGINTGNIDPKLEDWSILDQAAAARAPQDSQHIGGDGSPAGLEGLAGNAPINPVQGADINDTLSYITALAQAAPGVGFGAVNADPKNRTAVTIEIGDRAWGTNTVA